jgi:hypothetical protein
VLPAARESWESSREPLYVGDSIILDWCHQIVGSPVIKVNMLNSNLKETKHEF